MRDSGYGTVGLLSAFAARGTRGIGAPAPTRPGTELRKPSYLEPGTLVLLSGLADRGHVHGTGAAAAADDADTAVYQLASNLDAVPEELCNVVHPYALAHRGVDYDLATGHAIYSEVPDAEAWSGSAAAVEHQYEEVGTIPDDGDGHYAVIDPDYSDLVAEAASGCDGDSDGDGPGHGLLYVSHLFNRAQKEHGTEALSPHALATRITVPQLIGICGDEHVDHFRGADGAVDKAAAIAALSKNAAGTIHVLDLINAKITADAAAVRPRANAMVKLSRPPRTRLPPQRDVSG